MRNATNIGDSNDVFAVNLTADGSFTWGDTSGESGSVYGGVAADPSGLVYVTG